MMYEFTLISENRFTNVDLLLASNDFVNQNVKFIHNKQLKASHFVSGDGVTLFYSDNIITDINQKEIYRINTYTSFDEDDVLEF